ncbi:MAG: hypothetical protein A07HR60_01441 [uncultured archaeon A07HR60]|nr:MAG: hypothetical protein A07HR60_01441 [uncultured archaeon A07HR60]
MNRRQFLCALTGSAGLLAGCTDRSESQAMLGVDTRLAIEETRVIADTDNFVVDFENPQSRDNGSPPEVEFAAELFQPQDAPPEIEFRLTNTGPQRIFYMAPFYPFDVFPSLSGELMLLPKLNPDRPYQGYGATDPDGPQSRDGLIPESNNEGCWRVKGSPMTLIPGLALQVDTGETLSNRSSILVSPDGPCPPAETQMLSNVFSIGGARANKTELVVELRVTQTLL